MDAILKQLSSLNVDFWYLGKIALVLLLGTFLFSAFGRFVFGKRSALNNAASSAIGILFLYALTVVLNSAGAQFEALVAPLPFVTIAGDEMQIFSFENAHYTVICSQLLSMVILSFLTNLPDAWLPKGKNIFTWVIFRCLTVILALVFHLIAIGLLATYLPEGIATYAPVILIVLLAVMLLTGALKILVGAVLTTVNPIIGGLYTFFFATIIGKQITKAVLTTAILSALVAALNYFGCTTIVIATAALMAYIPFLLILAVVWYVVYRIF